MFKVAIVGCGLISTLKYIPIFKRLKGRAKIVGLCDLNERALEQVSTKFRIADTYKDFKQMLLQKQPDIVVVCTPPSTHKGIVIECMEHGAHVLVEKPMALTSADCEQMVEASRRFNKKLGVMHNQMFNPAFEKACNTVKSGKIGRFLGMRILLATSIHDMVDDKNHWAHRLPGGIISETAPHAVYLSLALLDKVKEVHVSCKKLFPSFDWSIAEDYRFDLIADNAISSVALIYGTNQAGADIDIFCTKGHLKVDLQTRNVVSQNRFQGSSYIEDKEVARSVLTNVFQTSLSFISNGIKYLFSKNLDCHYIGINRFLDYVSGATDTYPAPGEQGKEVESIMEKIVKQVNKLRT